MNKKSREISSDSESLELDICNEDVSRADWFKKSKKDQEFKKEVFDPL